VAVTEPPRFPLASLPTPLVPARRLAIAIGSAPILVKRDDLTGFALAGNKARKLELLVADALAVGADTLLTGGGPGSNHCQATAAAARVAGLACVLVMYDRAPAREHPNLRLARAFGAEVRFTGDPDRISVDRAMEALAEELAGAGRRPYVIPRGGASALGAAAYALAVRELTEQLAAQAVEPAVVVVAAGSCGTHAGLLAGTVAGGHPWRVVGAAVSRPVEESRARILELSRACAGLLETRAPAEGDVEVVDAIGPGYGVPSPEGVAAGRLAAWTEGLLLDPVFTAKALGMLLGMVREGLDGPAVFVHTGGLPSALHEGGLWDA
jgi:1-aminocyclopropane-1-carboxylate deaminase/D-cysteine desulfhydrase-like pyridoxal-dependent ACC family enzyme